MLLPILGAIVLLWMFLTYKARMRTRNCRWREDHARDTPDGRYFHCVHCGAEIFAESNVPPQSCLRAQRPARHRAPGA